MGNIFEDELFGDVPSSNKELVNPVPSITPVSDGNYQATDSVDEEEAFELPEEDDNGPFPESTVPKNSQKPVTNIEFLSRMLHPALRSYLRENQKWLRGSFSESLLSLFMDICTKIEDESISPEILDAMLPDLGVSDLRKDIIVRNYKLITEDTTMCLAKTTYEKFREIVYKAYFDSVNEGNAVETLEAIQNSDFFLPPFGIINSDTFKQVKFGDFDMQSIMEDLGSPLYSHFAELNEISPINGYIPSQVTMISGPPGSQTGDTRVMTLDHGTKTLEELNKSGAKNIEVYCIDDDGKLHVSVAERCVISQYCQDIIEIELSGGMKLKATPDHWYRDIEGKWWEAQHLKPGMSLTPFHRKVQPNKQSLIRGKGGHADSGYEACYTFVDKGKENFYTHRMCKEYLDPNDEYEFVHHNKRKDDNSGFDSLNNEFKNLILFKTRSEHWKHHCQYPEARNQVLEAGYNTRLTTERVSGMNSGDKSYNRICSALKMVNWMISRGFIKSGSDLTEENYNKYRDLYKQERNCYRFPTYSKVCHYFNNDMNELYEEAVGYSNYDIVSVKRVHLSEPIPMYDLLNVEKYRNFAVYLETKDGVDCGVISHNCFVGGTKLRQPDGTLKTIYQMYEAKEPATVMYLEDDGKVDWTWKNEGVQKTGSGTEFTKVYVNTMNVPIVATRNHQFLVMMWRVDDSQPDLHTDIQLKWVEAQKLKEGDILVSHPMNKYVKVQKVENVVYRKPVVYYDVVENKNHNYYINAGEEDICVHNSGKTLLMMNEAVEALRQGKKVLYAAIGDLKPYDFASRICSMIMKMPMTKTAMSLSSVYDSAVRLYPYLKENLTVQFISPDKYTPNQWFKLLESMGAIKDNDVFFIDYDTNFATERDSMYAKGDEVYTMAYTLSQIPGKYVFIGSQPKIGNWKDQELGLETASESSRKQQIVDVMITLSVDRDVKNPNNHMGTINVPKNRRGGTTKFKYFLDPTGVMVPVTSEAYLAIRDEHVPVSVVDTEFYDMNTKLMPNALKDAKKEAETVIDDGEVISE